MSLFAVRNQEAGFTLVELVTVTAIVGILTGLAVPAYNQWIARYQLKQAASEIQGQMTHARWIAMNRNTAVRVALTTVSGKVQLNVTDVTGTQQFLPPSTMMGTINGVTGGPVQFSSMGLLANGSSALIQVSNIKNQTYSVWVNAGGKAIWCPKSTCP
jgi:prepilin-type N-terminal cleavage/methylation domain-containing protein